MPRQCTKPVCIYCGGDVRGVRKGEHILPRAIGGVPTIKHVCSVCNSGLLSDIDRELCSRSPLSIIAAQELDARVWETWDVDHAGANLLLEGKPDFKRKSMTLFPQMIFESHGTQMRGDYEQMNRFGSDAFQRVFVKFVLEAFRAHEAGEKRRLNIKRVELNPDFLKQYRYPPRVFSPRPISTFRKGMSFELRYLSNVDKRFALANLDKLSPDTKWRGLEVGLGSQLPVLRCFCDAGKALRALAKLGVNLLAGYCSRTAIDRKHFRDVILAIMGETELNPKLFEQNGFVWPSDLNAIKSDCGHAFRLLHDRGRWHVYSSFFGGRVCSVVRFQGPSEEDWRCADIIAPLRSRAWAAVHHRVLFPLRTHVEWHDFTRIIPSLEMLNVQSRMTVKEKL